jgi:hypothetical protein
MADYTTITDAQVDPEAPITSELMSALRDNPIAITEGASGAPKVQTAGIQDDAVTAAKLNVVTSSYSGSLADSASAYISRPNATSFIPSVTGQSNTQIEAKLANGGLKITNLSSSTLTWAVSWSYVA